MIDEYSSNKEVTKVLDFGNSIWIARDKFDELKDSYREKVSGIYDASIRGFREEDPEGAINDWVKEVTRGKIEKIAGDNHMIIDATVMTKRALVFLYNLF